MPTYEAIYEDGQLKWVEDAPPPGRHRVEVAILDPEPEPRDPEDVERILEEANGAWGTDKTIEEIDQEIEEMRSEWDRSWYDSDPS